MEKIPCKTCDTLILSATAKDNNGDCMPCYKKKENKRLIDSRQVGKPNIKIADIDVHFQGDNYWKICRRLSEFLDQFYEETDDKDLPTLYRTIDSTVEFVSEYNSSGLFGYLDHCSGANAENFKRAIKIIGADDFTNVMDSISSFFPDAVIPVDDEMRDDILWSEGVENKISELETKLKNKDRLAEKKLLKHLIDYLLSRRKEFVKEINTCGQVVTYK